jgi:hypothetical protein
MNWEYKTVKIAKTEGIFVYEINTEKLDAKLNNTASEGWELVTITSIAGTSAGTSALLATFKRQKN